MQRGCISPCSSFATRRPAAPPPSGLRPLSASPPPPLRPPTPSCPALSRVRPSSHRHPVHSPSFLMLGSYSRCAARAVPLTPESLPRTPFFSFFLNAARSSLSVRCIQRGSRSFPLSFPPSPTLALFRKKKEEDLGQFLSHKPADRAAPIKNASLRMAIGPQRASGVMPNRSLSPAVPRGLPPAVGVSFRRASSSSLPVLLVRSLASLCLFRPFLLFFSTRGKNARRPSIGRGDR